MYLQIGDSGLEITALQTLLGVTVDGDFGPRTKAAVISFQSAHGLYPDGIVGPLTSHVLEMIAKPVRVGEPLPEVHGIDIYQGDVIHDWSALSKNGWKFAFIKSSEGVGLKDPRFGEHRNKAKVNDVISGPYHFMSFHSNPRAQAQFMWNTIESQGGLDDTDLPPVLDWEYADGNPEKGDDVVAKMFLEEITRLSGRIPIIYMNKGVADFFSNPAWMKEYPLWLAAYVRDPKIWTPRPWDKYSFWQYSGSSPVPGIGNCDVNVFNGSLDDLKALIRDSKSS